MTSPIGKTRKPGKKVPEQPLEFFLEGFKDLDETVLQSEINLLAKHCSDLLQGFASIKAIDPKK